MILIVKDEMRLNIPVGIKENEWDLIGIALALFTMSLTMSYAN